MTQGVLEELVSSFSAAAAEIMKISFFQSRIKHFYVYTFSNGIDLMFNAVITKGVLEQLVPSMQLQMVSAEKY